MRKIRVKVYEKLTPSEITEHLHLGFYNDMWNSVNGYHRDANGVYRVFLV